MGQGTPAQQGYHMPAEWAPHEATWLAWPHQHEDWPGKFEPIPWVYTEIVFYLHKGERVRILVNDPSSQTLASGQLSQRGVDLSQIDFYLVPTNRAWIRDYGPLFLRGETGFAATDWHFNGWAKYDNWHSDDAVPAMLADRLGWNCWQPTVGDRRVVLEGGSIDVNGEGLLLTTEECLLSPIQARNPELSRADLERVFAEYLGVREVIWLGRGIVGDDTHGHVDDLTRFVAPNRVVTVVEDNPNDDNYVPLQENLERLQGTQLEVISLPMPEPVWFGGQRLPASYANFYIANGRVLVPTFNDPNDRIALGILAEVFADREVIGIHAGDLVWGLGTLHCMTQQQPSP